MWTICFQHKLFFIATKFSGRQFLPTKCSIYPSTFLLALSFLVIDHKLYYLCTRDLQMTLFYTKKCKMIIFTQKKCTLLGWKNPSKKAKVLAKKAKIPRSVWKSEDLRKKPRSGITGGGTLFGWHGVWTIVLAISDDIMCASGVP